jgi:hypothetical protein
MISTAAANGMQRAFVPAVDASEAALVGDVEIIPVQTLADLVNHLSGEAPIARHRVDSTPPESLYVGVDFSDVKGQEHVKRGLEIAASGAHNALMCWTKLSCLLLVEAQKSSRTMVKVTRSCSPSSVMISTLDFFPHGGLVSTRSKRSPGLAARLSAVRIGGSLSSLVGPMLCRRRFIAQSRGKIDTDARHNTFYG